MFAKTKSMRAIKENYFFDFQEKSYTLKKLTECLKGEERLENEKYICLNGS